MVLLVSKKPTDLAPKTVGSMEFILKLNTVFATNISGRPLLPHQRRGLTITDS